MHQETSPEGTVSSKISPYVVMASEILDINSLIRSIMECGFNMSTRDSMNNGYHQILCRHYELLTFTKSSVVAGITNIKVANNSM